MFCFFFVAIIVGFNSTNYYVNECEGQVHIKIEVIGSLQRAVVIHLSTNDLTATGKRCLLIIHGFLMQLVIPF